MLSEFDVRREGRAALRLQAQQNARCFEDRSLALAILPNEKILRTELNAQRIEATKHAQFQLGQHGGTRNMKRRNSPKRGFVAKNASNLIQYIEILVATGGEHA